MTKADLDYIIKGVTENLRTELRDMLAPKKWMSVAEVKSYYGIKSDTTIQKYIEDGTFYGTKLGGKLRIDRDSVEKILNHKREWM